MKKLLLFSLLTTLQLQAQEPSLPAGLGGGSSSEPTFIMNDDQGNTQGESNSSEAFFDYNSFIDVRAGLRLQDDPVQKDASLGEVRFHNELSKDAESFKFKAAADFLLDTIRTDMDDTDLEDGTGLVDLREFNISFTPTDNTDVKVGRQILTWGTGDLLFINDLFPKDWRSFFVGRDLTYLKAPSDAIKVSWYNPLVNVDLVYTPRFDSDRHIDGSKNSYLNPLTSQKVGYQSHFNKDEETAGEVALRLKKNIGSIEYALYGYHGFWKSPMGFNAGGQFIFPELSVYGASIRAPLWGGIANFETGYYHSRQEDDGTDPYIPNDEARFLIGYEHELVKNTTGSFQYYVEHMMNYDEYTSTATGNLRDESRHMLTLKVRRDMWKQTLALTVMVFYSPTDKDGHFRLNLDYKITDDTKIFLGSNVFFGEKDYTFWGQFEDNSNAFTGFTYNF